MKVILGCDPLLAPLTGIGHYTNQIAKQLDEDEQINLKLFAHGQFFERTIINRGSDTSDNATSTFDNSNSLQKGLRARLAQNQIAVSLYRKVMPYIEKRRLNRFSDYIFHAPNFILPEFDGKSVVTIHDLSTVRFPDFHPNARIGLVNDAIENAVENANHILTDSELVRSEIIEKYSIDKTKISALHLGVSTMFRPRTNDECIETLEKYRLAYQGYFIFISTIEPRKNVLRLLTSYEICREVNAKLPPLVLIGGQGWNSSREHEKMKELEQKGWIKYLGYVEQHEVPELLAAARALLFPSLYEGFGLPVAEAIQSGVPVITSDNSAMAEFTVESSLLINPYDTDAISRAITNLNDMYEDNAITIEAKDFSWQTHIQHLTSIYRNV